MNISSRTILVSALSLTTVLSLNGCSLFEDKKVEYQKTGKSAPLEVPPDLTQPITDDRYANSDAKTASGTATYSGYTKEKEAQKNNTSVNGQSAVLPIAEKAKLERAGGQRWISIKAKPEQVWPVAKQFLLDSGYQIKSENAQTGILETEWLEGKPKMAETGIRKVLQKAISSLYSTGMRDKFRIRLERGSNDTTEVYISHQGMEEVYDGSIKDSSSTLWQPRPSNPELEAEMLQKLMVRLGTDEEAAKKAVAEGGTSVAPQASVVEQNGASKLALGDPFDRAWRRVGLALDKTGFTVEDRDRSKGVYYVRYIDPASGDPKKDEGLLSKLKFWKSDEKKQPKEQYHIRVSENNGQSFVEIQNNNGEADKSETGKRILNLLHEQLK